MDEAVRDLKQLRGRQAALDSLIVDAIAQRCRAEALRQEVKPYNIRTTVISPGAVDTELPGSVTEPDVAENANALYESVAVPADSFADMVLFAMSQPEDVDVNEILFRPTRQER